MLNKLTKFTALLLIFLFLSTTASFAGKGLEIPETDGIGNSPVLFYFFDLRERESYIQLTNAGSNATTVHVQIWDVSNNCNENNFFDAYTGNDTHVYNMRDIQTNDTNPSGVVLPDGAYGFVSILDVDNFRHLIGNFRINDTSGYEYRTNAVNGFSDECCWTNISPNITFNYNIEGNIELSDVVGISFFTDDFGPQLEILAADIIDHWASFDVDIYDLNEVPFSCRNVIFACTDQDNPLYEELLEVSGEASVASFEYGINNAIPHSRGGELLCPGNNISNGFVTLNIINSGQIDNFIGFIGLNSGNGRGSMDSFWYNNDDAGDDDDDIMPPPG